MNLNGRELFLDSRHLPKHLPDTPQAERLLKRGQSAHVFYDEETMLRVARAIYGERRVLRENPKL
jgi:hypothetical protein